MLTVSLMEALRHCAELRRSVHSPRDGCEILLLVSACLSGLVMIRIRAELTARVHIVGLGPGAGWQPLLPKTHVCDTLFMGNGVAPIYPPDAVADRVWAVLDRVDSSKPVDEDAQ